LADDEESMREVLTAVLSRKSLATEIETETASNGNDALKLYRERGPFHLVLTDYRHEGPDGVELARLIHEINPAQPIGLMTGPLAQELLANPEFSFILQKPLEYKELIGLVLRFADIKTE
jgi:DNA-binding NtrC family response regulator